MDETDNFCRRCGQRAGRTGLPVERASTAVTLWRPQASPMVKGAAVMAAGTIGQFVVRRAIGSLMGGGGKRGRKRSIFPIRRGDDGLADEAQIITETVMLRRVRIRRQA
jgi:hypothetical protein